MEAFEFPKIHAFPPLYTKQPNMTVLNNQLDSWCNIILSYCEYYKITTLTLTGSVIYSQYEDLDTNELPAIFANKEIDRSANDEFRLAIFRHLIQKLKKAEFITPKQPEQGVLIYWRSLVEWGNLIHDFVESSGQLGTILTVYELTKLEDSGLPEQLKNMDYTLLVRVLKNVLIKQGKAQILMSEDDPDKIGGVKIV